MTVIGIYKSFDKVNRHYDYIMKVVSWGGLYYIRYDEYQYFLSPVSNILAIGNWDE